MLKIFRTLNLNRADFFPSLCLLIMLYPKVCSLTTLTLRAWALSMQTHTLFENISSYSRIQHHKSGEAPPWRPKHDSRSPPGLKKCTRKCSLKAGWLTVRLLPSVRSARPLVQACVHPLLRRKCRGLLKLYPTIDWFHHVLNRICINVWCPMSIFSQRNIAALRADGGAAHEDGR